MSRTGTTANNVFDHPEDVFFVPELSEPLITVVAFNYEVPAFTNNRFVRAVVGGWTVGGIVRYATGMPIPVPASQNQLAALLFQNTRMNRIDGQPLFLTDLDSNNYDPNAEFVLNPAAWSNPAAGQFGSSLPYYDDFRYQRRPDEQLRVAGASGEEPARFEVPQNSSHALNRFSE